MATETLDDEVKAGKERLIDSLVTIAFGGYGSRAMDSMEFSPFPVVGDQIKLSIRKMDRRAVGRISSNHQIGQSSI